MCQFLALKKSQDISAHMETRALISVKAARLHTAVDIFRKTEDFCLKIDREPRRKWTVCLHTLVSTGTQLLSLVSVSFRFDVSCDDAVSENKSSCITSTLSQRRGRAPQPSITWGGGVASQEGGQPGGGPP